MDGVRRIGLFLTLSVTSAVTAVGGALFVGDLTGGDAGFFLGGLAIAALAVLATVAAAVWGRCVPRRRAQALAAGALVGLVGAGVISVLTAITFVIPLFSFTLVGAGAVIADLCAAAQERRASGAPVA